MIEQLPDLLAWIEPRALLLALVLPPVIRVVGHWIPEELFMVAMGVLAARSGSLEQVVVLFGAVTLSHFATDQITYLAGCWLKPRVGRFPWVAKKLESVTARLAGSPGALWGLVPARVLPLGRGAWMAGCGMVGIGWKRFAAVDFFALLVHLATWSGLGWWLSYDIGRLQHSAEVGKIVGTWVAIGLVAAVAVFLIWRSRKGLQPAGVRASRRMGK
ncbi:MAG: hypothetical protein DRJ65_23205 [Acidobacteria bacterium]|nr:MAG: hypothetical protein DRJ65_23205 [Acidobacteriota bacterium]